MAIERLSQEVFARYPIARYTSLHVTVTELEWYQLNRDPDRVLGIVLTESVDHDFNFIVLRFYLGAFHAVDVGVSFSTPEEARLRLHEAMRSQPSTPPLDATDAN